MMFTYFVVFIIIAAFLYYLYERNKTIKKLGVPGPEPLVLFGNLLDIWGQNKVPQLKFQEWTKLYGPVYGFMEGGWPMLVTSDIEFLQEVLVKKFDHFHGRKEFSVQRDPENSNAKVDMFQARGARWKRLRMISNPTFTSAKIKQMMPKVHACLIELLDILDEKCSEGKNFDIYKVYQAFSMDVIGRVAFAVESSVQRDETNELLKLGNGFFRRVRGALVFIPTVLPALRKLILIFAVTTARLRKVPYILIEDRMEKLVEERRKVKATLQANDFIDLLLNAEADPNDLMIGDGGAIHSGLNISKKLTASEIASQSLLFLLAGYETTSTALTFITYFLSTHPDVQNKVLDEIDQHFSLDQEITYESVQKLPYLECVIQETLRLYPLGSPVVARRCMSPCTVKGVHIPAGVTVMADVWSLHYSEELWGNDAKEFNPDRFLPDHVPKAPSHPFAYLPFGAGPRICIGMRFAMLEMKVALCSILTRYRFKRCLETEDPPGLVFTGFTVAPQRGLFVMVEKREG